MTFMTAPEIIAIAIYDAAFTPSERSQTEPSRLRRRFVPWDRLGDELRAPWIEDAHAVVKALGDHGLVIADPADISHADIPALLAERNDVRDAVAGVAPTNSVAMASFLERLGRDDIDAMTEHEWGEWVNNLPRDEFIAMISLDLDDVGAPGADASGHPGQA